MLDDSRRRARLRLSRGALALERRFTKYSDVQQLRIGLGLFGLSAAVAGLATLPLLPSGDQLAGLVVLVVAAIGAAGLTASSRPALPGFVLTTVAIAAQTSYVVVTGAIESPYLPGFLLIVLVVGIMSSPGRAAGSAVLGGVGLTVAALSDQSLETSEVLTVVTTFVAILLAGVAMSWLALRRRVRLRHIHRRMTRAHTAVARRTAESRTDPLTGLGNRRAFDEDFRARLSAVGPARIGLVFADVDNLKEVNDRLGHEAGDDMLRALADGFAATLRAREAVYRIGGDEFVAIVGAEDLGGLVERLGSRVVVEAPAAGTVSASIGSIRGESHDTAGELPRRADHAMYRSKRGREQGAGIA